MKKLLPVNRRGHPIFMTIELPYFKMSKKWKWQIILLGAVVLLLLTKDVSVQFSMNTDSKPFIAWSIGQEKQDSTETQAQPMNVSLVSNEAKMFSIAQPIAQEDNTANTYQNITPNPDDNTLKRELKRRKQISYVKRYARVAQVEMERYGIPASITLAQGLLESDCGESRLAKENNNHFGIKCFSKTCHKGHCSNFTDDSHKDFFRRYKSSWESYRAHSNFLQKKRYKHLQKLDMTDYEAWAHGLKKAGYATDPNYGYKLIRLIEDLQLYRLDRID